MIKLIWFVAVLGPAGPISGKVPETTTFTTEIACQEFGVLMTPRIQDWMRGRLNADWGLGVAVKFQCGPNGDPA